MSPKQYLSQSAEVSSSRPKRSRLTKLQLERKRENDREAQRQIRMKTKNRLGHLESLVATLQEADGSRGRVFELVQQVKDSHKMIEQLQEALKGIGKLVEATVDSSSQLADFEAVQDETLLQPVKASSSKSEPPSCTPIMTSYHSSPSRHHSSCTSTYIQEPASPAATVKEPLLCGQADGNRPDETASVGPTPVSTTADSSVDQSLNYEVERLRYQRPLTNLANDYKTVEPNSINRIASQIIEDGFLEGRLWYLAGTLLNHILSIPRKIQTPQEYGDDIPIRAVVHSWAEVAARYELDLGWQWLRQLDEKMYSSLGTPERLAVMRVMRLQYELQVHPQKRAAYALPAFMMARPAQSHMQHDPLVEHWVWPGLREHILFSPLKYATNRFMENFRNSFRFVWPFDPEDSYVRNTITGMYSYSSDFVNRHSDLRSYSMKGDFFNLFPELKQDIPSLDPSPWNSTQLLMKLSEQQTPCQPMNGASETPTDDDLLHWPALNHNLLWPSSLPSPGFATYGSELTESNTLCIIS